MPFWLRRGANASLSREAPGLKQIKVGLGWDAQMEDGSPFDLDVCVFVIGPGNKVRSDSDLVFYNNKQTADGSVVHLGDNLTGEGEGDDEQILIDLEKVPTDVVKIAVCVAIHEAEARGQNFGMVKNSHVRVLNQADGAELGGYRLTDAADETALIFGEFYKLSNEWKFRAVGQGFQLGLGSLAQSMGVECEIPPHPGRQGSDGEPINIHDEKRRTDEPPAI